MAMKRKGIVHLKKLYHRFFCIPKGGKVPDTVLKTRIVLSAFVMLVSCMIFCSATFAWFTSTKKVETSPITAASYSLQISVGTSEIGTCSSKQSVSYTCLSATEDKHTFTLHPTGNSKKGYCVITVNKQPCGIVLTNGNGTYTIAIQAAENTNINFSANWGEYKGDVTCYESDSCIVVSSTWNENNTVTEGNQKGTEKPSKENGSPTKENKEEATTEITEENSSSTTEEATPTEDAEASSTSTGEAETLETPATSSELDISGDNTIS